MVSYHTDWGCPVGGFNPYFNGYSTLTIRKVGHGKNAYDVFQSLF